MSVTFRAATLNDVAQLVQLELSFNHDELSSNAQQFHHQGLSHQDITMLIKQHWLVVASVNQGIIGYVIAAKWDFFGKQRLYQTITSQLSNLEYGFSRLSAQNTCQYGPVWVAKEHRGQGIFEGLVEAITQQVKSSYPYMVAFIAEENERSFAAHTQKAQMQVIDYLSFEQRDYYLLLKAC